MSKVKVEPQHRELQPDTVQCTAQPHWVSNNPPNHRYDVLLTMPRSDLNTVMLNTTNAAGGMHTTVLSYPWNLPMLRFTLWQQTSRQQDSKQPSLPITTSQANNKLGAATSNAFAALLATLMTRTSLFHTHHTIAVVYTACPWPTLLHMASVAGALIIP
jgi:hypothetical protein